MPNAQSGQTEAAAPGNRALFPKRRTKQQPWNPRLTHPRAQRPRAPTGEGSTKHRSPLTRGKPAVLKKPKKNMFKKPSGNRILF